jgi:hypothetical protein
MILALVTMGNKAVSVDSELGEFTVPRDDFDSLDWESAAQIIGATMENNPIAVREYHSFLLRFDIETQFDVIRAVAAYLK